MDFRWIPHKGIDLEAVERMKQHFPKPAEAPPIAWFMDPLNQGYFSELAEIPVEKLDASYLEDFLSDTGGGIKIFGRFEEWVVWFKYLLPHILLRIFEQDLLDHTITYFLNLYTDEIAEEYPGFRKDVLGTLAQCMMMTEFWDSDDLSKDRSRYDDWWGYSGTLCACLFFCLKYLNDIEMASWVASLAEIKGAFWQGQISHWLNGLNRFFVYIEHPEKAPDLDDVKRNIEIGTVDAYMEIAKINWFSANLVFRNHNSSKNVYD
ncbi:MAG: hypothetical protein K8I30_04925, partial [Anaerolineae bacterium]|nr:hypothetical protein [Anaerolineae bacterium]